MQAIIRPIITEKSMANVSAGRYVFKVRKDLNKAQIKNAIASLYKVEPIKINIILVKGEAKLLKGRYPIKTKIWKKAIITLKKGQKITGFEEK